VVYENLFLKNMPCTKKKCYKCTGFLLSKPNRGAPLGPVGEKTTAPDVEEAALFAAQPTQQQTHPEGRNERLTVRIET